MNTVTLYNNFYIILTTCMLDSALEPFYNLSKTLLLLQWILKYSRYGKRFNPPVYTDYTDKKENDRHSKR